MASEKEILLNRNVILKILKSYKTQIKKNSKIILFFQTEVLKILLPENIEFIKDLVELLFMYNVYSVDHSVIDDYICVLAAYAKGRIVIPKKYKNDIFKKQRVNFSKRIIRNFPKIIFSEKYIEILRLLSTSENEIEKVDIFCFMRLKFTMVYFKEKKGESMVSLYLFKFCLEYNYTLKKKAFNTILKRYMRERYAFLDLLDTFIPDLLINYKLKIPNKQVREIVLQNKKFHCWVLELRDKIFNNSDYILEFIFDKAKSYDIKFSISELLKKEATKVSFDSDLTRYKFLKRFCLEDLQYIGDKKKFEKIISKFPNNKFCDNLKNLLVEIVKKGDLESFKKFIKICFLNNIRTRAVEVLKQANNICVESVLIKDINDMESTSDKQKLIHSSIGSYNDIQIAAAYNEFIERKNFKKNNGDLLINFNEEEDNRKKEKDNYELLDLDYLESSSNRGSSSRGAEGSSSRGAESSSRRGAESSSRRYDENSSRCEYESSPRRYDESSSRRGDESSSRRGDESSSRRGGDERSSRRYDESSSRRGGDESSSRRGGDESSSRRGGDESSSRRGAESSSRRRGERSSRGSYDDPPRNYEESFRSYYDKSDDKPKSKSKYVEPSLRTNLPFIDKRGSKSVGFDTTAQTFNPEIPKYGETYSVRKMRGFKKNYLDNEDDPNFNYPSKKNIKSIHKKEVYSDEEEEEEEERDIINKHKLQSCKREIKKQEHTPFDSDSDFDESDKESKKKTFSSKSVDDEELIYNNDEDDDNDEDIDKKKKQKNIIDEEINTDDGKKDDFDKTKFKTIMESTNSIKKRILNL